MELITTHPASLTTNLVAAGIRRMRAALVRRRKIAQIIGELGAMSDRDLADIGFLRGDIARIARETVDGH